MKKVGSLMLAVLMVLSLAACGTTPAEPTQPPTPQPNTHTHTPTTTQHNQTPPNNNRIEERTKQNNEKYA